MIKNGDDTNVLRTIATFASSDRKGWLRAWRYPHASYDMLLIGIMRNISGKIGLLEVSMSFFAECIWNTIILSWTPNDIIVSGQPREVDIGAVKIGYTIYKLDDDKVFVIDLSAKVCTDGQSDCILDLQIADDYEVPIPLCNSNFSLALPGTFWISLPIILLKPITLVWYNWNFSHEMKAVLTMFKNILLMCFTILKISIICYMYFFRDIRDFFFTCFM